MARIGFVGLGNMGLPMAGNLTKAGHEVLGFDIGGAALEAARAAGLALGDDLAHAVREAEVVVTMLPAGPQVRAVHLGEDGILRRAAPGALLIDASTIDVATAREVADAADAAGYAMLDAPVSGGVGGAEAGSLTFMAGGSEDAFARARPVLAAMGKTIVHCGGPGTGQAAKICNNMMLGIQMLSVCEAMVLAENLGLDPAKLFEVASRSSGQCWSLTAYCPVPGPVPASPANRGYRPGFATAMMLKDLRLAQSAAQAAGSPTPLGAQAAQLYGLFAQNGNDGLDFSAIIRMMRGQAG
ncbi:MAG: 3-hydroxyisobutyrate dehydrogenase [Geminicoccaceae bacterium]|nr:3-hydroxyisobutyrate dehydrogenase [Geminicoccaceae bacterium]